MIPNTHNTTDEHTVIADTFAQNLISDCEYGMMQKGYLPPFVTNWVMTSLGNIPNRVRAQIKELSNEEPYSPSTAISIVFSVIESQKSIRKWVKANLRKSYQSIPSAKKVDGKWDDAQFTLWPPYKSELSRNNTFKHQAARYVFKHEGIRIDLGVQDGKFSPVMHDNPNSAMQAIATRLGRRINGDYNKIVQTICGNDYVATTTTAKVGSQWVVLVTPMRDAKITPSRFAVTEEGGIINGDIHNQASSISEVEYALIKGVIDEQDDEASENYSYEFSEEFQAQMMLEANGEKMDESRMTPTELIIQSIAAENGDLIDFMVNGQVKDEYWQIVDSRVEQSQKEYFSQLKLANPMGDDNALNRRALYKALYRHESEYDALEDSQSSIASTEPVKSIFTVRGSKLNRKRFFGQPSAYECAKGSEYMPARNPVNETKFLSVTNIYEQERKPTVINKPVNMVTSTTKAHFRGSWGSNCVNSDGQRAVAPTKMAKQTHGKNMNPRLAAVVFALDLTGSLKSAKRVAKNKLRFGL
jgi:hypothetical protein